MECPVCKLDLHPAMAQRYSGTCSQGCEAIAEVATLRTLAGEMAEALERAKSFNGIRLTVNHSLMVEIESALTKWREVEKNEDLEGRAENERT